MNFFKPYELFYYEKDNKNQTRCVENFSSMPELLKRKEEIKKIPGRKMVFEHLPIPEQPAKAKGARK